MTATTTSRANPLILRQKYRSGRLLIRKALFAGARLGISAAVLGLGLILINHDLGPLKSVMAVIGLFVLSVPVMVAYSATYSTAELTRGEVYDLLCLTPLSNTRLTEGLVMSALFRSRILLALTSGLIPVLVLSMAGLSSYERYWSCQLQAGPPGCAVQLPQVGDVILSVFSYLMLAVCLFGLNFLAVSIGVGMALACADSVRAGICAVAGILVVILFGIISLVRVASLQDGFLRTTSLAPAPLILGSAVLLAIQSRVRVHR